MYIYIYIERERERIAWLQTKGTDLPTSWRQASEMSLVCLPRTGALRLLGGTYLSNDTCLIRPPLF